MRAQRVAAGRPVSTEEWIIEATFRVLAKQTISRTRIPLIAREAAMSQGIIHYHFETKEQLLIRVHEWLLRAFAEMRGVTTGWSGAHLVEVDPVGAMIEYQRVLIGPERDMIRVFYDLWVQGSSRPGALRDAMKEHFRAYRDLVRRTAFGRLGPRADVAPAIFLSLLEGAALQLILDEEAFDANRYFSALKRLADGLGAASG
jgi:AcrR family transcriptional regulator